MSGCAGEARLQPVPQLASRAWSTPPAEIAEADPRASLGRALGSTELEGLIDQALAANPDAEVAAARVDQARALLRVARAAMLPSGGLNGQVVRYRSSGTTDPIASSLTGGLSVSYDVDLFGANSAKRRASLERLRAAGADRDAVLLVIESETARAYVQRAALAERVALLDANIARSTELERIIKVRLENGAATRADLGFQTIRVRALQQDRETLEQALEKTRTALAVLCGREAPVFQSTPAALERLRIPQFGSATPRDLLLSRPDIRSAEARISAAGGDVAVARAAFLPTIRLSADVLGDAAGFGGPAGVLLSAGSGLLAPIFDRGRLKGELQGAAARQRESVADYRKTLLAALAEVEDALTAVRQSGVREQLVAQMLEESRITARLVHLQFLGGEADIRAVLDADQDLTSAESAHAVVLQERLEAAIDLFRATGGRLSGDPAPHRLQQTASRER
ncbi:MAG: efflux transporter outer membrane subunit [Novosphingobium sp.]|nr:efflux transporter outer membrane subunit [Novosphingobium sp.]